jgi:hypothetical protein
MMLAYKFRSASQLEYAFDIVLNNRLHCSDWRKLNDPMEGMFSYSYQSADKRDYSELVDKIIYHKERLLVCSLSRTFDCHLLWAHYASGFAGLAIEVDLPENSPKVKVVEYRGVFGHVSFNQPVVPSRAAEQVLSSKYKEWAYEKEVRILQSEQLYELPTPVNRIIVGHRMHPAVFEAVRIVCEDKGIALCRTGIGDEGIDADPVPPREKAERIKQPITHKRNK